MALEQKLSLKLSQRLVMTPSLQQAIKLLQMTRPELETVVAQELEANPVLEEIETEAEEDEAEAAAAAEATEGTEATPSDVTEELLPGDRTQSKDGQSFEDWLAGDWGDDRSSSGEWEERQAPPLENTLTRQPDLYEHLISQIHLSDLDDRGQRIAEQIVGNLNPDGFLVASIDEICRLGSADEEEEGGEPWTRDEVESVLARVRRFDPAGIGCTDLRECLLLQLDLAGEEPDSLVRRVVAEQWTAFLRRQYPAVAKALGVPLHDLEPVIDRIRSLELRPGRLYSNERTVYVEPDVFVVKVGDDYVIQLNDDGLPRLRVSRAYRTMLRSDAYWFSRLGILIERADAAIRAAFPGAPIFAFGHVGDGNIHYNVGDASLLARRAEVNRMVYGVVGALGGSISAEHGLGQLKRAEIREHKSALELELMRAGKGALDPPGLMNPGELR